jgi:hypothetical protein
MGATVLPTVGRSIESQADGNVRVAGELQFDPRSALRAQI